MPSWGPDMVNKLISISISIFLPISEIEAFSYYPSSVYALIKNVLSVAFALYIPAVLWCYRFSNT